MTIVSNKINRAILNKRLNIDQEGEKYWYNYKLRITNLYWARNLYDGYKIEVYDKKSETHLDTIWH